MSQTQVNGKMISDIKIEMRKMKEIIEMQNDMIKTLLANHPNNQKDGYPEGEGNFEESRISSFVNENRGLLHHYTLNQPMSQNVSQGNIDLKKVGTHSHQPRDEDWD